MEKITSTSSSVIDVICCLLIAVPIILTCVPFISAEQVSVQQIAEKSRIDALVVSSPLLKKCSDVLAKKKVSPVRGKRKDLLYISIIYQAAERHQVDPALVKAIIMAESSYNPRAISKKGASGLMQLMPGTAASLGVEDIFNPEDNIDAGVGYFRKLLNQFDGDVQLALAAYNAGSRNVRMYQGVPPFKATKYYIKKVFKYYRSYKAQMTEEMSIT